MSDLDKEALRITNVFARFPDFAPFVFEVQIDITTTVVSATRAYIFQQKIIDILLAHAPLAPKSARKAIKSYYAVLGEKNSDSENSSPDGSMKVYIFV